MLSYAHIAYLVCLNLSHKNDLKYLCYKSTELLTSLYDYIGSNTGRYSRCSTIGQHRLTSQSILRYAFVCVNETSNRALIAKHFNYPIFFASIKVR